MMRRPRNTQFKMGGTRFALLFLVVDFLTGNIADEPFVRTRDTNLRRHLRVT